jgi:hypothetical protein
VLPRPAYLDSEPGGLPPFFSIRRSGILCPTGICLLEQQKSDLVAVLLAESYSKCAKKAEIFLNLGSPDLHCRVVLNSDELVVFDLKESGLSFFEF